MSRAALGIGCRYCGAGAGEPCRDRTNLRRLNRPHPERCAVARRVARAPLAAVIDLNAYRLSRGGPS